MRNPIRTALLKRIRPLTDNFTAKLLELAQSRVEAELERLPEAIDVALSAFESSTEPDLLARALGPELTAMMKPATKKRHAVAAAALARATEEPEPTPVQTGACGAESGGASEWTCQLPKGHMGWHWSKQVGGWGDPPKPIAAPKNDRDNATAPRVPPNKGRKQICSECGYVGGNKRGCGKSHPTQAGVDVARDGSPIITVHSAALVRTAPPPDRRALIAARAAKPVEPARAEPDDDEDAEERWSASRLKDEIALAESQKRDGELPVPSSTFAFGVMG